jgi:hypothetical protein
MHDPERWLLVGGLLALDPEDRSLAKEASNIDVVRAIRLDRSAADRRGRAGIEKM